MEEIAKKLQQKGYRLTSQRQQVLDALTSYPQSVLEIISFLKSKGVFVDKVTIYRTLNCFVELGVVAKTQFKDKTAKYELLTASNHHHHLVCEKCSSVEDIPLNEEKLMSQVITHSRFKVLRHNLEFFGVCKQCQ